MRGAKSDNRIIIGEMNEWMNEYRLILPVGDEAMNNECRFSFHSWYYKALRRRTRYGNDDDDDDSTEWYRANMRKIGKKVAQQSEMRRKIVSHFT